MRTGRGWMAPPFVFADDLHTKRVSSLSIAAAGALEGDARHPASGGFVGASDIESSRCPRIRSRAGVQARR